MDRRTGKHVAARLSDCCARRDCDATRRWGASNTLQTVQTGVIQAIKVLPVTLVR